MNKTNIDALCSYVLNKYRCNYAKNKVLNFAKAFLKYLTKTRLDTRYHAFSLFLEKPKILKERKNVTSRIVTKEDITNVLRRINQAERDGMLDSYRAQQFTAFVLFGAYTGQRHMATTMKLTVGQFRNALKLEKPVVHVKPSQDKIKMERYVPLHPRVIEAVEPLLNGRGDDEPMFQFNVIYKWMKREKIPLTRISGHFVLGDLRKFAEQYGDIIQWDQSNRAYIMTHGVGGIDWKQYKRPLPEHVYDVYMKYWRDTRFAIS